MAMHGSSALRIKMMQQYLSNTHVGYFAFATHCSKGTIFIVKPSIRETPGRCHKSHKHFIPRLLPITVLGYFLVCGLTRQRLPCRETQRALEEERKGAEHEVFHQGLQRPCSSCLPATRRTSSKDLWHIPASADSLGGALWTGFDVLHQTNVAMFPVAFKASGVRCGTVLQ